MATTAFGVNHPLAVKNWSRKLFHEALKATWIYKFIGTGSDALIQTLTETQKGPGDTIYVGLRMLLSGAGIQGDGTLEGNEEAMNFYRDTITINQLRHAVRSEGKMSEQRVPYSVREEAMMGLRDWWADRMDTAFFNQIAGNTNSDATDTRYTGNNATTAPDTSHIMATNGHDTEASLSATTTHAVKLADIDRAVNKAKTLSPMIRPLRVGGEDKYVMFLHPNAVRQLRIDTNTGQWLDIQKAGIQGGQISKNPIYTGALGEYNGVVLHEAVRLPVVASSVTANTSYRRAVLCGAQAAAIAFGQGGSANRMTWVEELFDYKNQLGVAAGLIFGLKKTIFNSADFSTIVVSGYAPAP